MARIIYKITNLINGKSYIGQTKNFKLRMRDHIRTKTSLVSRAIQKYGKDTFEYIQLAIVEDCMADEIEQKAIAIFNTLSPSGYNLEEGGCLNKGCHSDTKLKLRLANIGRKHTEETKLKMKKSMTKERKDAIVENFKKHPKSEEVLKEQGRKMKERWADENYKNKVIASMKETNKNKPKRKMTEEQKLKLKSYTIGHIPWNKGIPRTEETKNKLSISLKGRKAWNKGLSPTEDTRKKQSLAHNSRSGILNISWNNKSSRWIAKDKKKEIGKFETIEDAKKALDSYHCNREVFLLQV